MTVSIVPRPSRLQRTDGEYVLPQDAAIAAGPDVGDAADILRDHLRPGTRLALPTVDPGEQAAVRLDVDPQLAPEAYRLSVTPSGIRIRGGGPAGVLYGVQTLRQLLPPASLRRAPIAEGPWTVPCLEVEDEPRFTWRGVMLDVARHFMPREFVLKLLDLLSLHKLNVLHLHLTEDQGWRIEIKRYPRLTDVGAWRRETVVGHQRQADARPPEYRYDGTRHGGFYTQDDIREIVAYAASRAITVVPEIEMPGHAQAAIAAYPELGNTTEQLEVYPNWGIDEHVLNAEPSTIEFMQNVLDEVLALFPSQFIHVGGDECPKREWRESPRAQQRMRELGLHDEDELQSWIIRQMDDYLTARGRRLVGWDEILEGGLAPGATVMSWRGEEGGIAAARAGHDVVMAPNTYVYFDYGESDAEGEPLAIATANPLEHVYSYDPVSPEMTREEAGHVLGTQAQLWTEYVPSPRLAEYRLFPRVCAFAECAWSGEKDTYAGFLERLRPHLERLDALDVGYRPLD